MRTDRRLQSLLQTQRELMCKELWLYSEWGVWGGEVGHVVAHRLGSTTARAAVLGVPLPPLAAA